MGDKERKKHKDFIEPGSKEDAEATAALNDAFDVIPTQSEERYRRERETV